MNISNENRLLLYCTQVKINKNYIELIKDTLNLPLNWKEILNSSLWYGTTYLLYHHLQFFQDLCACIPEKTMIELKKNYHANVIKKVFINEELNRVIKEFKYEGIEVILLKGIALEKLAYGDRGLRPMGDIDFLVKKEDLPTAETLLLRLGYSFYGNKPADWYRKNHQEINYISKEKKMHIDLHWHISNKSHPSRIRVTDTKIIKKWWKNAIPIELPIGKVQILSPFDSIFHLLLHFLKHRFMTINGGFSSKGALIQMCDILEILKHYKKTIDWSKLGHQANEYGISNITFTSLFIVNKFIGNYDDSFNKTLCGFNNESLDQKVVHSIGNKIFVKEDELILVPNRVIKSQAEPTFCKKIKRLLSYIFPNLKFISEKYNIPISSKKIFFYYLLNPLLILLKYFNIVFAFSRIKEDIILNKWINSKN